MGCQTLRKVDTSVQGTAGRGHWLPETAAE